MNQAERNKKINRWALKGSFVGNIRLYFAILNNPWEALQIIKAFCEEHELYEAELDKLRTELAEEIVEKNKLQKELFELKGGKK